MALYVVGKQSCEVAGLSSDLALHRLLSMYNTAVAYTLPTQKVLSTRPVDRRNRDKLSSPQNYCNSPSTSAIASEEVCRLNINDGTNVLQMVTTLLYVPKAVGLRTKAGVFSDSEAIFLRQPQQRRHADNNCVCYQTRPMPAKSQTSRA